MSEPTEPGSTRLADLLVSVGIDRAAVDAARAAAARDDERFVSVVLRRQLIDGPALALLVAGAMGGALHHIDVAPAVLAAPLARRVRAHVLGWITIDGERRHLVGMADPTDVVARLDIMRALGAPVHVVVIDDDALSRLLGEPGPFEQLTTGATLASPSWDPDATLPRTDLLARIADTLVGRPLASQGETQPTVRTRLLRALASPSSPPAPLALLRELRLLVVAHDPVMRARAAREITLSKSRSALSVAGAISAAHETLFDAVVLLGPLQPDEVAGLESLAERACVVAVASDVSAGVPGVAAVVNGPLAETDLAAAIVRALVLATGGQ